MTPLPEVLPLRAASPPIGRARLARFVAALLAVSALALLAPAAGRDMAALYPRVDPSQPYLLALDPLLQYVRVPLAVIGAAALVMAPGLLLALLLDLGGSLAGWVLHGFALSLIALSAVTAAAQSILAAPIDGAAFVALALALSALIGAALVQRDPAVRWPLGSTRARGELAALALLPALLVVALEPKFFWESLNGDGAHALEASRLLLHRPLPFWPEGAGDVRAFPGLNSSLFTLPNAWYLRLFGETECGVRLPFALLLAVLYAALLAVIEHGSGRRVLGGAARALIGMGLASYALVMAYSATYDPYCSDIGLPATQDTLLVICLLGVVVSFARVRSPWLALFCLFTLLSSPAGPMVLGALGLGVLAGFRRRPWKRLVLLGACAAAGMLLLAVLPRALDALGLPAPGVEHAAGRLARKFRHLQLLDWRRIAFLAVPVGIYPTLGLFAWRRGDDIVRALIATTLVAFGTYYVLASVSLHYFVPAMLLPLALFWRHRRTGPGRGREALRGPALAACGALALVALWLGLPRGSSIYTGAREVGERVELAGLDGYGQMRPEVFRAADLLATLFTLGWSPQVPDEAYAGSPLAWHHYARRAAPGGARPYLLAGPGAAGRPTGEPLAHNEAASLWVRDEAAWRADRTRRPADSLGHPLYALPRDVLFGRPPALTGPGTLDLGALLSRGGSGDR